MAKSSKLRKADKLSRAKKDLQKTLKKVGYYRSKEKYGVESIRPCFPDLSFVSNCSPTSDRLSPTIGKKELPVDAKRFNIQTPHKQGPMLFIDFDGLEYAGGKKP